MLNYLICKKCGEVEDKHAKTGARIDGQYYCQGCYDEEMERIEYAEFLPEHDGQFLKYKGMKFRR